MKKLLFFMAVLWAGGAFGLWYYNENRTAKVGYRTVGVARGDLLATINATGTLEPAGGRRRRGPDRRRDPSRSARTPATRGSRSATCPPVEQGTVLAQIVDDLFKSRVDQMKASAQRAEAEVMQAEARIRQTERELARSMNLNRDGRVSAAEHDTDARQPRDRRGQRWP